MHTIKKNYDSAFCGSLPIHLINLIQPYGVLLVLDPVDYKFVQVSENASLIFNVDAPALITKKLGEFITTQEQELLRERSKAVVKESIPLVWTISGKSYLAFIHASEEKLLVELDVREYNTERDNSFVQVYQEIKYAMGRIEAATSVLAVAKIAALELKRISGFDKIMIYQFDDQWNGNVIAEEMSSGMESYIGFKFPASDIPQQARMLYLRNPYRFIPDRDATPVKLYPVINPTTQSFLDLSECNVRNMAGVHIEYLRNMGIRASMSARILVDNVLWGLIACHHRDAKDIDFQLRSVFEMLSNIISAKIAAINNKEMHDFRHALGARYNVMVEEAFKSRNLKSSLLDGEVNVMQLFSANGVMLALGNQLHLHGDLPTEEQLKDLLLWLHTKELKIVYHTDSLPLEFDQALDYKEKASGLLVIPIDFERDEYVVAFRAEVVQTIEWGGNPEERIHFEKDNRTYHPRNSFMQWIQHVEGTSTKWRKEELAIAESLRSFVYEFVN